MLKAKMQEDIRHTALYLEAEALYEAMRKPGTGQISDALEAQASPDGKCVVFSGAVVDVLEGTPPTRIFVTDLHTGDTRSLSEGPNTDRLPKFSPGGRLVAFLSDRRKVGDFQLYLLDMVTGETIQAPTVDGWVEYLHWSPDGARVLLGVAGHGADISGGQGAVTSKRHDRRLPSWIPTVNVGAESYRWRSAWVYDLTTHTVRQVSRGDLNIWESTWCGNDTLAAVVSSGPSEGLWYSACLALIELDGGGSREVFVPQEQLGWPASSPSGKHLTIVEAVCSDRLIVAGELRVIDLTSSTVHSVDTQGVDVTCTTWSSDRLLLLAGHRGFETVVQLYDALSGELRELWTSQDVTTGGRYVSVASLNASGDCVLVGEGFMRAPEIAVIRGGQYACIRSFDLGYADQIRPILAVEQVRWRAPDGLDIEGWLLRPKRDQPHPVIMDIHGGPVWHARPRWLGRSSVSVIMFIRHGYVVFLPNPRGSAGRGREFARRAKGDMNGADTYDHLSGLDNLVACGTVDPSRIGVMGVSYGGNMTAWLITQDSRFAAAVAVAPHTNMVTEHLLSNIPQWVSSFLGDDKYTNPGGKYFERSSTMQAHKAKTPTLNICGALDRCTPPEEAVQFHNALLENGVESALVTYPDEGHGIRKWPALIDYAARVVGWFQDHMPEIPRD